jgi:hypothetical protein
VDATTRLRPWDCPGGACLDSVEAGSNLGRPRRFSVRIYVRFEALNQFARQRGSLLIRQSERFYQKLLRIHG